jgi:virginiamycin A acetyltransferase
MIFKTVNTLLNYFKKKKKWDSFLRQWNRLNSHNKVVPINIFPIERVKVGFYSYGELNLLTYAQNNLTDILSIGNFVSIASDCKFFLDEQHQKKTFCTFPLKSVLLSKQHDDDALARGSIFVDDEVWIGNGVKILSGVSIGKGAIVAAGSLVSSNVLPYSIVGGVPAKHIKFRFEEKIINRLNRLRLIDLPEADIRNNIDVFYKELTLESLNEIEELFDKNLKW